MNVKQPGIALSARPGQNRALMRLVKLLVGRKTHVAIKAEDTAIGITDQRYAHRFQCLGERQKQSPEWRQHLGVVDRFTRLEPQRVVVLREASKEFKCRRSKADKSAGCRLHSRLAQSKNSRLPAGPVIGLSVIPTTDHPD